MTLNINLVENSFNLIKDDAVKFSASFYNKLFDYYPELLPLFEKLDLYGESSPEVRKAMQRCLGGFPHERLHQEAIVSTTHVEYRNQEASN